MAAGVRRLTAAPEPQDEAPERGSDAPGPLRAESSPNSTIEGRLEGIVDTIQEFAGLRFGARALIGPDGDIVDAVAAGVNFLGEELDAAFREVERRVADRTAELAIANGELTRRALHDQLTGLPNRHLFWEYLSHRLALADRRQTGFAVLFLDLDGFKAVNDSLGHAAGDHLLAGVASRLRGALRESDIAARLGGDEFAVLVDEAATVEAAAVVAQRVTEALRSPYEIEEGRCTATASVGVAIGPAGFRTADDIVVAADHAMYEAKQAGGGRYVLYLEDPHAPRSGREAEAAVRAPDADQLLGR